MKILSVLWIGLLLCGACVESGGRGEIAREAGQDAGACQDLDGDGYGEGCALGGDCNDSDKQIHDHCGHCVVPAQGCECAPSSKPVSCYRAPTTAADGTPMCHEGTRYCREGQWSACEDIVSYPKPEATNAQAVVNADAGPQTCNDCNVNCFVIRDNLDPSDAGIASTANNATQADGGGISLTYSVPDAGTPQDAGTYDPSQCVPGTAPDHDCDGIPDAYDPYPNQKPFATANPTIFLDIAPGETGTGVIDLQFYLNSADVYLLVDQTGSMADERDQLKADLVSGDFINDPNYNCADYDFDLQPNNELKNLGVVGAIRCLIRDANFGVGYFREIPFSPYANSNNITFRNLQDITSDVDAVTAGVAKLTTVGNIDWPEASMIGLYTAVTGNGLYFGVDRPGLPPRTDCPSLTWGYPCFRQDAIPIVIMFTDAQLHNGPTNNDYPYDNSYLATNAGTTTSLTAVPDTNESFTSAFDVGDVTNKLITFSGDTTSMRSDLGASDVSCVSSYYPDSPDALFKFTVSSTQDVTVSTQGSDFDTTVSLYRGLPASATVLPSYPNDNDTGANAYAFGAMDSKYVQASGDSSSLSPDYSADDLACGTASGANDAAFTFSLSQATRVALDTTGSSFGTTIGLFSGTPPALPSYTPSQNLNDTIATPESAGSLDGKNLGFSGNTAAASIAADYSGAQLGCSPADGSPDAVYTFSLGAPTRVRVSSEGSSFPTVLALTDANGSYLTPTAVSDTNEAQASAYDVGSLAGAASLFTGSTASMSADYPQAFAGCSAGDSSPDAVYKFTLPGTTNVQIDTSGSSFDTVLSLFGGDIQGPDTAVSLSSNGNETSLTAYDLGTVNSKRYIVTGGDTSSMAADYTSTQIGCGGSSNANDAVFKFHLDTATRVRVDTSGSSYDTLISLHNGPLPDLSVENLTNDNDTVAQALSISTGPSLPYQEFDGDTSSLAADVAVDDGNGCAADAAGTDAVFSLSVTTAGNYVLDTSGSSFDTVLGLYPSTITTSPTPAATALSGSSGDTLASAVDAGTLDGTWKRYTGSTASLADDSNFNSCSAWSSTNDVFFKFTLGSQRDVVIDTIGSSFNTVLGLFDASYNELACNNDLSNSTTDSRIEYAGLQAGTYYVIVKGRGHKAAGDYVISLRDASVGTNIVACDDDSGGSSTSRITTYLTPGSYYVVVKGKSSSQQGSYKLTVKAQDAIDSANRLTCNDDVGGGDRTSLIESDLDPGDYWVVVKGYRSSSDGAYTLTVQDVGSPPTGSRIDCNNDTSDTSSLIARSLDAGTYYVVVKGTGAASGTYKLTMRDTSVAAASALQCDYNSGASGSSLIERDLAAGNYRVIVKGKAAGDKGDYKLNLRDLTAVPSSQLACDHNSGSNGKSYLEQDLSAGTYTVILSGDTSAAGGAYQLSVRDATSISLSSTEIGCDDDSGGNHTSRLTQSLTAGTYVAAVKGYRTTNVGTYQFTVGAASTTSGYYVPPTWSDTLAALKAHGVYVLPVLSCHDDPYHGDAQGDCVATRNQATALANATGALGVNLQPLVFDIDGNGSGLSKTIVNGVAALAHYLEMNVQVRVVFDPDANPGFGLTIRAVDEPGDGCQGVSGVEHLSCAPGASPRFELEFTNPADAPVLPNPNDPLGGYSFRAELIGNDQFIVDQVPIYIIPQNVTGPPQPVPQVAAEGSYWQDVSSPGCVGNQTPDWHDLSWNAAVPEGTSVKFGVCASDSSTALATCQVQPLCTVTGGGPCTQDSDCSYGFCSTEGNCHTITGAACASDADCYSGATCRNNTCTYAGQPVYVAPALGSANYSTNLRMQISMTGNTTTNESPIVHDWSLTYICNNTL